MDGFEAQQERIRPQLSHRALKTGGTDAGFQQRQQAAALRRGAFARSLSYLRTEHIIDWRQRRQHNQPVHQIGAGPSVERSPELPFQQEAE